MMDTANEPLGQVEQNDFEKPLKSSGRAGVILGVVAVLLVLLLGAGLVWALTQLNRQMAQLSGRVERAEQQSQTFAQQAVQAAANAQAAAQQRDEAKQLEADSAAQAQSALETAAAAQQQANQAEQKAEEYRKQ